MYPSPHLNYIECVVYYVLSMFSQPRIILKEIIGIILLDLGNISQTEYFYHFFICN